MQALGSKGEITIQEESTFNTDPGAPDTKKIYFLTEGLRKVRPPISSNTIQSDRNPTKPARGNIDISGPINLELQAHIGTLLKAILGSVATTGAGPYSHTIKVGSSLPSLLIQKGFTDITQYFKYNGCKVNRANLNITPEGFQDLTVDFIGVKETVSGSSFDATPQDLGKTSFDGMSLGTIEEGGSAIAIVTGVDGFSIENNLDGNVYTLGNAGLRKYLPAGMVKVSGTLKAIFEDLTLYNKAINDTESSLKLIFSFGDGLGSAGNESLEMFVPELVYSPNAPVIAGPQGVQVELPFEAFYDNSSEASVMQMILKNAQATV